MRLLDVEIKNFRSLKELNLNFIERCQVLIGINETGKSNILRALSLLSEDVDPKGEDVRESLHEEDPITEAYVRFRFDLSEHFDEVFEKLGGKLLTKDLNRPFFLRGGKHLTLEQFVKNNLEGILRVDLKTLIKSASYWRLSGYEVLDNWKYIKTNSVFSIDGIQYETSKYSFIDVTDFPNIPLSHLVDGDFKDFNIRFGEVITEIVKDFENNTFSFQSKSTKNNQLI